MLDLSVVIVACNEERIIGKTIAAIAPLAAEIILVDSGSTDNTINIAKQFNAQCHHQQWLGYASQKNYALSLAKRKWILSLDADEVATESLLKEITDLLSLPETVLDGYKIPRLLLIGNEPLKHGGFYPDRQLRLFQNGKGKFIKRKVHESVQIEGNVGQLKSPLLHYAYTDFTDYATTLDRYARLSAEEFAERKIRSSNGNLSTGSDFRSSKINEMIHPVWTFFYRYLLRAGFLDGSNGLKANWIYKDYVRKKISYLRQLKNQTR